jgi:cytoskeletal protein RodZ
MATSTTGLGLQEIRRCKGVSLGEIAESTKISTMFLQAIESEEFKKLPGGVFDRNYLRQYAAAIGFDEAELMERYRTYQAERESKENPPPAPVKRWSPLRWISSFVS